MAELKTKENNKDVDSFINQIENEDKKNDCFEIIKIMKEITKSEPKMWGENIVGFDSYHYKYESGHEGDSLVTGFSPRKQHLVIYIVSGFSKYTDLLEKLGKCKTGSSCLYIKKLSDIDKNILKEIIKDSFNYIKNKYQ
jgi:hypothetical protein